MDNEQSVQADTLGANVRLDEAVASKLPPGSKILSVTASGKSLWVATVKITVQLDDFTIVDFFKKGAQGELGKRMMEGTFVAEHALHSFSPDQVPRPVAWGTYMNNPEMHFYLSQFGFGVTTHLANVPVNNTWNHSWASFWAQQMTSLFDQDKEVHEKDVELEALKKAFLDKAVPTYLLPLEGSGRSIKPCIIHSDLWPGNIKPRQSSNELCLFDACAYWGHNEADLGICRNPRYRLGQPYITEYLKRIPKSEPEEDFDGRNATYAMKYHTLLSIMYCKDTHFRQILKNELISVMEMVETRERLKVVNSRGSKDTFSPEGPTLLGLDI